MVAAHRTVNHDYAAVSDQFGGSATEPTATQLAAAGGYASHYAHMRSFWNAQLRQLAQIKQLPDPTLIDAYKTGFIYTQITRAGSDLKTGVNGYDKEYSHDVIGILANMLTQGYRTDGTTSDLDLLMNARDTVGTQAQYDDGIWKYSWPWAIYLQKTGDLASVKANFDTPGPQGDALQPSIKDSAHAIAAARTGPGGIIENTPDIDADGYWTIDDYSALMGLASYKWLAQQVGDQTEATWANNEYNSLLGAVNQTLTTTITSNNLDYIPCSMVEPNDDNRCKNPQDANWAAPFLFGRWAWDGYLFDAAINGPGSDLIDATYDYGFGRLQGILPPNTLGGYGDTDYSTGYNAGYGEWGLASSQHRDQGILDYQFMIKNTQSGPYSWWESVEAPDPTSPWIGNHPTCGRGRFAARLGLGRRQPDPARLAGGRARRRQPDRRSRRAAGLDLQRTADHVDECADHGWPAPGSVDPREGHAGHVDPDRSPPGRSGALPAAGLRGQPGPLERRGHRPGDRHGDPVRQHPLGAGAARPHGLRLTGRMDRCRSGRPRPPTGRPSGRPSGRSSRRARPTPTRTT